MKTDKKKILLNLFPYILAFLISFIGGIIVFAVKEIDPFGDKSLLCMDLWGQYFPMYVQQARTESISDLLYSWNGAFGYNNWAQSAYYCNSIFLILMKIVPLDKMITVLDWLCLIKICLSSVTCLAFLHHKLQKKSPILIAGAVAYSLCAYVLAFISQFMWTDALIYVPVILIGIEKLINQKKTLLYTLVLALTIISNFYIGFAVCIFSALYFICNNFQHLSIEKNMEKKFRFRIVGGSDFGLSIIRFSVFSLLAGAISALIIFPIGMAIGNTLASDMVAPEEIKWYGSIAEYLQHMLPNQQLSLGYSGANIATGILMFALIPFYFCNKKIKIAERIANGLLLVFLVISLNCNILDYIWHGLHFPNQLPGRWTFLLSLFVVLLTCSGIAHLEGLNPIRSLIGIVLGTALMIFTLKSDEKSLVSLESKYIAMIVIADIMILVASFLMWRIKKISKPEIKPDTDEDTDLNSDSENTTEKHNKIEKQITVMKRIAVCCVAVISVIQIYDSCANFKNVAQFENEGLATSNLPNYSKMIVKADKYGSEWKCDDNEFYRVEANTGFTFNPSMLGRYRGMGYYSSTMQGSVFELLRYFGNRVYAENVSTVYNLTSPVQNGLFGVKYFLDNNKNLGYILPEANLIQENEDCNIWENPTALSVAYAVSDDTMNWNVTDEIRAVQNQNDLLNKMCGREVNAFAKMNCANFYYLNATFEENSNWNQNMFYAIDNSQPVNFNYIYVCEKDAPIYLEHNFRAGNITVTWDGGNSRNVDVGSEKFCYLGEFSAGTTITIDIVIENVFAGCCGLNLYTFDSEAWNSAYEQLSSQQLVVESFDTTSIKGKITLSENSLVFSSIAQDGGWKVFCDGKEMNTLTFGDALLGVRISAGTHTIEFKYSVPGLSLGITVSIISLLVTIWICCPKIRNKIIPKKTK